MKYSTFVQYKSNILFIQRLVLSLVYIQILAGTYHLFVPSFTADSTYSTFSLIIAGIVLNVIGILIAARVADLEGDRLIKIARVITIGGIIHQYFLGVETIYAITIYSIAIFGENIVTPKLETVNRTQHYASREKLTSEVYNAVSHADNYMQDQLTWVTNSLLFLLGVGVISIFMLTIFNILPAIVDFVQIIQIIAIISLLVIIIIITARGFPKFKELPSKYDLDNI